MKKLSVCILFGGMSQGHEGSLRSARALLSRIDQEKYHLFPVGITKDGDWVLFGGSDYSLLTGDSWMSHENNRRAAISPVRGQGLLTFEGDCVVRERIDVAFPVLPSGEEGEVRGLLKLAGIPCVGSDPKVSAVAGDKALARLVMDRAGVPHAQWHLVRRNELENRMDHVIAALEGKFRYPMFVKPAVDGYSQGAGRADDRDALEAALHAAGTDAERILVEAYIQGQEVQVAVMGNDNPVASICGELDAGDAHIPARISEETQEQIRELAVKGHQAVGCQGLSRVDFFVSEEENRIAFKGIKTVPEFEEEAMYPKLFAASGIPCTQLIDELLILAQEVAQ